MKTLETLKNEILADGIIDAAEVAEVREVLFADGSIEIEEAEFLFEINNAVSGNQNHPSWSDLFIEAISSYLLDDAKSQGEIDADEAEWLFEKINGDGMIDELERTLLLNLKSKVKSFPSKLESLFS
jgi:uncharacterized membrane protein YebE (DUF533 family)